MKEFGIKKQFKLPKLNWGERKVKEKKHIFGAVEKLLDGWTCPLDEAPMEIGVDEGEVYVHIMETDSWVWLSPELAYSYGESLKLLANEAAKEKLGES